MCGELDEVERTRQIRRVLSYYDDNFTKYLASTIAFSEKIPEEINNQIRNAFTHLARAQEATDLQSMMEEIGRSISHIDRASRDCLKASIIVSREQLDSYISDVVFYHVGLTPDLKARYKNIVVMRKQAYELETKGVPGPRLISHLEGILRETIHTSDLIKEQYREVGTRKAKVLRFLFRWSKPAYTLIAMIVVYIARPYIDDLWQVLKPTIMSWFE